MIAAAAGPPTAVDIGPSEATAWLSEHGADYGLCPLYAKNRGTTSCASMRSRSAALRRTPIRRTIPGCRPDQGGARPVPAE